MAILDNQNQNQMEATVPIKVPFSEVSPKPILMNKSAKRKRNRSAEKDQSIDEKIAEEGKYPVVPFITDAPLYQPAEEIWNTEDPPLKRSKTSMDATEVTPPSWPPHIVVEFLYSYPIPFVNNLEVCADLFRHE